MTTTKKLDTFFFVIVVHACVADKNNYLSLTFLQGETPDSNDVCSAGQDGDHQGNVVGETRFLHFH